MVVGLVISAGALFWLSFLTAGTTYPVDILGPLILMGLGLGMVISTSINIATVGVNQAVLPLVAEMQTWLDADDTVAAWVGDYLEAGTGADCGGIALTGSVLAWSYVHGTVSLDVSGHFTGMGHQPATLLRTHIDTLADTFRL